jgi:alanyl-tRNA synthetase
MTDRLYYHDSYLTEFSAAVVDRADGGRRIYLDRTAFYPTSGGQPHDLGTLAGIPVSDVVDEADRIAHLLVQPLDQTAVQGEIDWLRRFDHMQQHTGQHLLSAVLEELLGARTVSVHFGSESATLDLDLPSIDPVQVRGAEARANDVVVENRSISIGFEEATEAAGLRKPSDRTGVIRIVTIQDLDRSPCGGTHVRATGEIGAILIRRVERVKKQVRLEFLCGGRAVRGARADYEILSDIAAAASAGIDEIPNLFEKQRADIKALTADRRTLEEELHAFRARDLHHATPPDSRGRRWIVHRAVAESADTLRGLAQAVTSHPDTVFVGLLASPPTILLASSAESGIDAGATLKRILETLGGRGGGSARMAQGTVSDATKLEEAARAITSPG